MAVGPLSGVKVMEYCNFISGPFCTKLLADLGAEVIKVERPEGDDARRRGPYLNDNPDPELSGLYLYHNTNKLGVTLNLESPEGRSIFKKLAAEADILVEDTKPGEMERLGLNYEVLKQLNPSLIMASITPFGQYGPYRDYKAYYLNTYHASGAGYVLPAASPNADREPIKGGGYVGESDVGVYAAVSIMGALFWRNAGGTGQYIDISKQEGMMALEKMNIVRYYMMGKSPSRVGVNRVRDTLLQCRDGGYIIVVLYPEKQWRGIVEALGNPEWAQKEPFIDQKDRDAHFEELKVYLREEAKKYDTEELFFKIQAQGTACAPICSAEQVYNSPQTKAREFFEEIEHPVAGKLEYPGMPYKFSDIRISENHGAPLLGQHNEEIYCSRLGYTKGDLVKLKEAGVI
ncbi:CoA transferase [[Clostridium] symbiosum]|uniref:CaiB/BaiF CoA transferase family protein n=1 Tax=Clostridium symbiosum TaxID=1512 RepID=UPI001D06FA47|nr:CoA transferase [[Clostridium] symbiosum]MCB6610016.1 CoA transferase [[Clostridium] symbiosum]MCB6931431.1 CoA transferase [[Clostridium] symbiosum]